MRDTKKKEKLSILWQQLLKLQPTNEDLRYIIKYVEPLRQEAQKRVVMSCEEIMDEIKRLR